MANFLIRMIVAFLQKPFRATCNQVFAAHRPCAIARARPCLQDKILRHAICRVMLILMPTLAQLLMITLLVRLMHQSLSAVRFLVTYAALNYLATKVPISKGGGLARKAPAINKSNRGTMFCGPQRPGSCL